MFAFAFEGVLFEFA